MEYKGFEILKYKGGHRIGQYYIVYPDGIESPINVTSLVVAKRVIDTYLDRTRDMYKEGEKQIKPNKTRVKAVYSNKNWAA